MMHVYILYIIFISHQVQFSLQINKLWSYLLLNTW
jgi:hypothetical protein